MGQYYETYIKYKVGGREEVHNSQNAIFMTKHGLDSTDKIKEHREGRNWSYDDPDSYGACFSGMKLLEHSWMGNNFVDGIVECIWDCPAYVAWIGDYSDGIAKRGIVEGFDESVYLKVWGDKSKGDKVLPERPFSIMPDKHLSGYLVNYTKQEYIDLAKYYETNVVEIDGYKWCIHPLPLLTAIGNGLGGGDYHPDLGRKNVGSWAMDLIEYRGDYDEPPAKFEQAFYRFDSRA